MAVQKAGNDAGDVAIDDGGRVVEGKATDGSGGVAANPGKSLEGFGVRGESAFEIVQDGSSGFLKVADAVVVAEALPGPENCFFRGRRNRLDVWELLQEFFETAVCENRGDRGLLEHDLGHKNEPWIACLPPGIGLCVRLKPLKKGFPEGSFVLNRVVSCERFFHGLGRV